MNDLTRTLIRRDELWPLDTISTLCLLLIVLVFVGFALGYAVGYDDARRLYGAR